MSVMANNESNLAALQTLPQQAEVIERIDESPTVFTLKLRFVDDALQQSYAFSPGQFNMLYLYGVGEIAISIASDPLDRAYYAHTIRRVGRVTQAMSKLVAGDRIGIRGPFGRGWPLQSAKGRDLMLVTGGLGCAPVLSVIDYVIKRREDYNRLIIMQGVRHSDDLIWKEQYEKWQAMEGVQVVLAASKTGPGWPWNTGRVTELIDDTTFDADNTTAMMCGPEGMMVAAANELASRAIEPAQIYLSMERNMQCAIGHCGHCQLGGHFVCKNGPVFSYPELAPLLGVARI